MDEYLTRTDTAVLRARMTMLDRAVRALINTSPARREIMDTLRADITEIDTAFEEMSLALPERPGDREQLRDLTKAAIGDLVPRLDN